MLHLHRNLDDSPSAKKITVPEAYPGTVSENRETVSAKVKTILSNQPAISDDEQTAIAKQASISEKLGTAVSDMKTIQKIQKHRQK